MNLIKRLYLLGLSALLICGLAYVQQAHAADGNCSGQFISSDGYIVSAAHCQGQKIVAAVFNPNTNEVEILPAEIVSIYNQKDLMVLKVNIEGATFLPLGSPTTAGQAIQVMGWSDPDEYGYDLKTYDGDVYSSNMRMQEPYLIGFIAPVYLGMSGGAVVNSQHQLVGVIGAMATHEDFQLSNGMSSFGLAVSTQDLTRYLHALKLDQQPEQVGRNYKQAMVFLIIQGIKE